MKTAVGVDAERLLNETVEVLKANSKERDVDPQSTLDQLYDILSLELQDELTTAEPPSIVDEAAEAQSAASRQQVVQQESALHRNSVDDSAALPQACPIVEAEASQPISELSASAEGRYRKAIHTILRRLRTTGLLKTIHWCWHHHFYWRYRERRLGIDTSGFIERSRLGSDLHSLDYEPCNYRLIDIALDYLQRMPKEHVFLDYGCGKGRVVVVAATRPFRRILGIERSAELCEKARRNVARANSRLRCGEVEVIQADAQGYAVPHDVSVVFFFNPFVGPVMEAALANLESSMKRRPRLVTIFYLHRSHEADMLARCHWLLKLGELPVTDPEGMTFAVYTSVPQLVIARPPEPLAYRVPADVFEPLIAIES